MSDALDDYDLEGTDTEVDAADSHGGDQSSSDTPSKPDALSVKPEAIPDKLKSRDQWVCWRYERRDDWTKPPLDAANGSYASTSDSSSWSSFTDALDYHEMGETDTDGIGFVVHDGDMVAGLDLDDCRWPDEDEREEWAGRILDDVPTYAEVSPSDTGYRLIGLASLPDGGNRDDIEDAEGHIEAYDSGRFLTMTGHHVDGTPEDIHEVDDEFAEVHERHIADSSDSADNETRGGDSVDANPTPEGAKTGLDDDEVVQKAKDAEGGQRFADLWNGRAVAGLDDNGGQSERDLALVNDLAFWTGGDRNQIDRLFRKSGLMRDKWDRDDYREGTIDKALDGRTDFYGTDTRERVDQHSSASGSGDMWAGLPVRDEEGNIMLAKTRIEARKRIEKHHEHVTVMPETAKSDSTLMYRYDPERGEFNKGGRAKIRHDLRWNLPCLSTNHLTEIERVIRDRYIVESDSFDASDEEGALVNLTNGVYDHDNHELLDHSPEYRFLSCVEAEYDPEAECPEIDDFFRGIVDDPHKEKKVKTLYEWAGFCLIHDYPIHRFLILHGGGRNGKSTYFNLLRAFLGDDNTSSATLESIANQHWDTAKLEESMLNVDTETADMVLGPEETASLKALSGGDKTNIERKFIQPKGIENTCKLGFAANSPPRFTEETDAVADRLLEIELPFRFKDDHEDDPRADKEADMQLESKITTDEELSGFLNEAIDGLRRVRERGRFSIEDTGTARERFDRYQEEADSIVGFASRCLRDKTGFALPKDAVWNMYKSYCDEHDHDATKKRAFFRQLWRKSDLEHHAARPGIENDSGGYDRPRVLDHLWLTDEGLEHMSRSSRDDAIEILRHMYGDGESDYAIAYLKRITHDAELETFTENKITQARRKEIIRDAVEKHSQNAGHASAGDILSYAVEQGLDEEGAEGELKTMVKNGKVVESDLGYYMN